MTVTFPVRIRGVALDSSTAREALVRLHMTCFRPCEFDPSLIEEAAWWLAFDQNRKPLAFAGLAPLPEDVDAAYLCRAGVMPGARGHGLHRRLIQVRLAFARRAGLHWVVTDTLKNPRCADNLVACGFEEFEPLTPWGLSDALYWKVDLWGET